MKVIVQSPLYDIVYDAELEEAREQGIEQVHIDDARRMKSKNYTLEQIAEITGLSLDAVKPL